jgi:hypothetical protein
MATSKNISDTYTELMSLSLEKSSDLNELVKRQSKCHRLVKQIDEEIQEMRQKVLSLDSTNVEETRLEQINEWIKLLEAPNVDFDQVYTIVETIAGYRNSLPLPKTVTVVPTNNDFIHETDGDDLFEDL